VTNSPSTRDVRYPKIDISVAHPARVWNYWSGGKDNFARDREAAAYIEEIMPIMGIIAMSARAFLDRVVRYLVAEQGVRQFLDIGTGLPTENHTHQIAQAIAPESRIVYVDDDPIVLVHARALLTSSPAGATGYIDASVRDPDKILRVARRTLNFARPVAVILMKTLNFVGDNDDPKGIVARLMDPMPSGSYLAVDHCASDIMSAEMIEAGRRWNEVGSVEITMRTRAEVLGFFKDLDLLEPGLVQMHQWRPRRLDRNDAATIPVYGGVGRKP
jgi:S-adenosyl methyltransferase